MPQTLPIFTAHQIRQNLRTGLIWAIALGIYVAIIILIFPTFRDSGALAAVKAYPEPLREAFGLDQLTSIGPFVHSQIYSYAPLVLGFFPIMAFSAAIAGAEERGALDILLGNPIPRRNVVLATWIAIALILFGVLVVAGAASWAGSVAVDAGLSAQVAFRGALNVFPITLAFGSFALLLSAWLRSRGAVIGVSFVVMFLMYLVEIIGKLVPDYGWISWASAFRFYGQPIIDGTDWWHIGTLLVISLLLLAGAVVLFDRRDVYT